MSWRAAFIFSLHMVMGLLVLMIVPACAMIWCQNHLGYWAWLVIPLMLIPWLTILIKVIATLDSKE